MKIILINIWKNFKKEPLWFLWLVVKVIFYFPYCAVRDWKVFFYRGIKCQKEIKK